MKSFKTHINFESSYNYIALHCCNEDHLQWFINNGLYTGNLDDKSRFITYSTLLVRSAITQDLLYCAICGQQFMNIETWKVLESCVRIGGVLAGGGYLTTLGFIDINKYIPGN